MNATAPRGRVKTASDSVETTPVIVLSRVFPARPGSFPDAEDFVRESLTNAPITNESRTRITAAVLDALLGAAGPVGASIHVALRIYPDQVEVDVLRAALDGDELALPDQIEPSFAQWMSGILSERGLSQEAGARELGVSVRTMSRWIAGATEPRLRDLRRIRNAFGEIPLN